MFFLFFLILCIYFVFLFFFFFNDTATTEIYTLSLHDALPIFAVWLADDSSSANDTIVRTQVGPSTSVPTQTAPEPTTTTPTTTTPGTTVPPPPPPPPKPALVAWPATKGGWTIVLDSVPTTNGRAGAVGEAKQALRLGLKPVGVIDSSAFSSLHPGYFVVFFGIYDNEAEAQSHVIEAHRRGYREPYPRRITR